MRHPQPLPVIIAGEPELGAWCPVCLLPTRLRVPLTLDDPPLYTLVARLEVCPGCGTGHAVPKVEVLAEPTAPSLIPREPRRSLRLILTRWLYERACRRAGTMPLDCAFGDCRYPGYRGCQFEVFEEDGTVHYHFCGRKHRHLFVTETLPGRFR